MREREGEAITALYILLPCMESRCIRIYACARTRHGGYIGWTSRGLVPFRACILEQRCAVVPLLDAYVMASVCGTDANYCIAVLRRWRTLDHMESTTITVEPSERDSIDQRDAWYHACMHHQRTLLPALFHGTVPGSGARNYGQGGRSKEIMDRGAGPKSFNHKITECSLFVWFFTLWMDSSKDKI
jgi:hypothetical protein